MIGIVAVSAAGRTAAAELVDALDDTMLFDGPAATVLPRAFAECDAVVAFLATGIAIRLLAPVLGTKVTDPGVVTVDEGRRFAVALLGGHDGGANELASRVADVLGCTPVITTATDATATTALDQLGWPSTGAVAAVTRAMLDGQPVNLIADGPWPIPALAPNVAPDAGGEYTLRITDQVIRPDERTAVLYPPSLVVGVGASRGVSAAEVGALVDRALADAHLARESVRHLATVEAKAGEAGIVEAARERGWAVVVHSAEALALVEVPNPSAVVRAAVGTPSVAEAAALIDLGPESLLTPPPGRADRLVRAERPAAASAADRPRSVLVVEKRASAMAAGAIARHRPRGRLAIVGIGPGARDLLTPRAATELRRASVVVGLDQYLDQIRDLLRPGTRLLGSGLGQEEHRAEQAVAEAQNGHAVALIGSGDAGIYAMASPTLELAGDDIDVVAVPGITAALAAAAVLGAPLGHDHVAISLSDLLTPWEAIRTRVQAAADADLVVTFYNPRSNARHWQLVEALQILAKHRGPDTPVGVVRQASRPDQTVCLTTLAAIDVSSVDMVTTVVVGSSNTVVRAARMVTPRGYRWQR